MNTRIEYMYRDAGNFKFCRDVVVKGRVDDAELRCLCLEGVFFIPGDVGLPFANVPFTYDTDMDHPWYELVAVVPTDEHPTQNLTADTLATNFRMAVVRGWREAASGRDIWPL